MSLVPPSDEGVASTKKELSEDVKTIIGTDAGYNARMAAMRQLSRDISPEDIEALMEFLGTPTPDGLAMLPIEYNSIKNDVMEILLQQTILPEGIGQMLTDIYNSPEHDEIWRNYSIQFMAPFYEKQSKVLSVKFQAGGESEESAQSVDELKIINETLWSALDERHNSNAGTALLGLDDLSDKYPEFEKSDVQAAMVDLANDNAASEANRITALRLCGQQGHAEALEAARDVAQNGSTTVLRCAAIATLGDLGTTDDRALLEAYAASDDLRIQRIAQTVLQKMGN